MGVCPAHRPSESDPKPLLKWYLEHGLEITKFHCAIKYEGAYAFKDFADAVSDART